tara:strand:- start:689 stop:1021 length:333 start_codon:yes stop_codon:yes gene_type:complete
MATKNRTLGKELTLTNSTIYTTPPRFESSIDSIVISNASIDIVRFSLDWYDSKTTTYYTIAEQVVMYPNSVLQLTDGFILQPNDTIRGLATVSNAITVSVKVKEEYLTAS